MLAPCHVDKSFVHGDRFDYRRKFEKCFVKKTTIMRIGFHVRRQKDGVGTAASGFTKGHGRAHPKRAGLVRTGGYDAPAFTWITTDDEWFSPIFGIAKHFDRGKK